VDISISRHNTELEWRIAPGREGKELGMNIETEGNIAFDVANVLLMGVFQCP
jgi:hypothetical protein